MVKYIYILLLSTTLLSQSSFKWEPLPGPMGTTITSIYKTDGDIILAGTYQDGYRSTNHGQSWERMEIRDAIIYTFFQHSSGRIFAGTQWGIYCSDNDAESWRVIGTGLMNYRYQCFAEDSKGYIYSGTTGRTGGKYYGVYRSRDLGETWTELHNGLDVYNVNQIIIDTTDIIYAATEKGVFYSLNDGDSWVAFNNFLASTFDLLYMENHVILAATKTGIYSFTIINSFRKQRYRKTRVRVFLFY